MAFARAAEAPGIGSATSSRCPQQTGKVERSHRIGHEEVWSWHTFIDVDTVTTALRACERTDNHERFSLALQGRTPTEKLPSL